MLQHVYKMKVLFGCRKTSSRASFFARCSFFCSGWSGLAAQSIFLHRAKCNDNFFSSLVKQSTRYFMRFLWERRLLVCECITAEVLLLQTPFHRSFLLLSRLIWRHRLSAFDEWTLRLTFRNSIRNKSPTTFRKASINLVFNRSARIKRRNFSMFAFLGSDF